MSSSREGKADLVRFFFLLSLSFYAIFRYIFFLRHAAPILTGISKSAIRVKTGDSNGEAADRSFNFMIFAAAPVSDAGTTHRAREGEERRIIEDEQRARKCGERV